MYSVLADIVTDTFTTWFSRDQLTLPKEMQWAMSVSFRVKTKDDEEGSRNLDLVIWAPTNYVQVWTRTRADVVYLLGDEDSGKEEHSLSCCTEWEKRADHDSCWRDTIRDILFTRRSDIIGIDKVYSDNGYHWYGHTYRKDAPFLK